MTPRVQSLRVRAVSAPDPTAIASLVPVAIVACFMTTFLSTGCARPGNDSFKEPSPIEELAIRNVPSDPVVESQLRGAKVYKHYCAICHGNEGHGDGFNSTNLAVPPRNFSSPQFWQQTTDEALLLVVSKGGPAVGKSVLMPAWGRTLTDRQIRDIVAFLHTLVVRTEPTNEDSRHNPATEKQR
jgi:mono/diheme cytochrome c family protein